MVENLGTHREVIIGNEHRPSKHECKGSGRFRLTYQEHTRPVCERRNVPNSCQFNYFKGPQLSHWVRSGKTCSSPTFVCSCGAQRTFEFRLCMHGSAKIDQSRATHFNPPNDCSMMSDREDGDGCCDLRADFWRRCVGARIISRRICSCKLVQHCRVFLPLPGSS